MAFLSPSWSDFITSTIGSSYNDSLKYKGDENWTLTYDQEGTDSNHWRNQSLVKNMEQGLPVGVLLQDYESPSIYRIFGLGKIVEFKDGKFKIESL